MRSGILWIRIDRRKVDMAHHSFLFLTLMTLITLALSKGCDYLPAAMIPCAERLMETGRGRRFAVSGSRRSTHLTLRTPRHSDWQRQRARPTANSPLPSTRATSVGIAVRPSPCRWPGSPPNTSATRDPLQNVITLAPVLGGENPARRDDTEFYQCDFDSDRNRIRARRISRR